MIKFVKENFNYFKKIKLNIIIIFERKTKSCEK